MAKTIFFCSSSHTGKKKSIGFEIPYFVKLRIEIKCWVIEKSLQGWTTGYIMRFPFWSPTCGVARASPEKQAGPGLRDAPPLPMKRITVKHISYSKWIQRGLISKYLPFSVKKSLLCGIKLWIVVCNKIWRKVAYFPHNIS